MGGRGPVHAAQRLAGLVLAHAVQLVPAAAQPPAREGDVAAAAEHRPRAARAAAASTVSDVLPRVASARRASPNGSSRTSSRRPARARRARAGRARSSRAARADRRSCTGRSAHTGPPPASRNAAAATARALQRPQLDLHAHPLARVRERRQRAQRPRADRRPGRPRRARAATAATNAAPSSATSCVPKSRAKTSAARPQAEHGAPARGQRRARCRSQRDGHPREQLLDDRGDVRGRAGRGQQPMGERVGRQLLDVVGQHVVAPAG